MMPSSVATDTRIVSPPAPAADLLAAAGVLSAAGPGFFGCPSGAGADWLSGDTSGTTGESAALGAFCSTGGKLGSSPSTASESRVSAR